MTELDAFLLGGVGLARLDQVHGDPVRPGPAPRDVPGGGSVEVSQEGDRVSQGKVREGNGGSQVIPGVLIFHFVVTTTTGRINFLR